MRAVRGVANLSWVILQRRVSAGPHATFPMPTLFSPRFHRYVATDARQTDIPRVLVGQSEQRSEGSRPANRPSSADEKESRRNTVKLKRMPQDQRKAFFEELQKSGRADVYHYSTMLSSCSNSAQAQALMSEMQRVGVQPNLVTYNTLIQKHNRDGQAELAQQVLEEMIANGVAPDVVTYSSIIDGLTRNQKHREAARMWRELQDTGLPLDLFAYNIAVNMFCRANRELNARKTIAQMTDAGIAPTTQTYTPLIAMYSRMSKPDQAVAILKEIQALGLEIDTRTYNAVISGDPTTFVTPGTEIGCYAATVVVRYGMSGTEIRYQEMELVWQARDRLEAAGLSPDVRVHTAMIHVLCINNMLEEAVSVFIEMEESGQQATVATMQPTGDRLGAMQWLWEARRRNIPPFSSYMQRDDRAGVIKADLHGMSALSSVVAVEFALSFAPRALHHKLVVVTGKGHHSRDRKAVVKPMIEGFLSEEGIKFAASDGNEGRLELVRHSATLPSLIFCILLLAIMWLMGVVMARDWLERVRQLNQHLAHTRNVQRLREELRRGLAEHASGRRGMADMAMLVHEIEREWKGAEQAHEALRTNPKHARASAAPEPSAGA